MKTEAVMVFPVPSSEKIYTYLSIVFLHSIPFLFHQKIMKASRISEILGRENTKDHSQAGKPVSNHWEDCYILIFWWVFFYLDLNLQNQLTCIWSPSSYWVASCSLIRKGGT